MKQTYYIILIDPEARTVLTVESNGTLEHLQQLVQTDYLESLRASSIDMLLFAEEPKDNAIPFKIGQQVIRGRAVIAGDGDVTFKSPRISIESVRDQVTFAPACFTPKAPPTPPQRSAP